MIKALEKSKLASSLVAMDSSVESKVWRPCIHEDHCRSLFPCLSHHRRRRHHHHHHHFHVSPHCPLHSYMVYCNSHGPKCSLFNLHPPPQHPLRDAQNLRPSESEKAVSDALMMHDENGELEQEEDEDPVFVLTDEWKDFFAKSEARRRLEKKQAKKKGKK